MIPPLGFNVALSTLLSLMALWLVYHVLFRSSEVARFRERVFELRDTLFDLVADEEIHPEDPAYVVLRRRMNGFIRFAHRLSIPAVAGFTLVIPAEAIDAFARNDEWSARMKELELESPELYRRVMALSDELALATNRHVLLMSPVIAIFLLPVILLAYLGWSWFESARTRLEDLRRRIRFIAENDGGMVGSLAA